MKLEHIKSYKKLLDKIRSNTYNIKKEDYQHFQELTKSNTIYSFFHFSNLLFFKILQFFTFMNFCIDFIEKELKSR